MVGTACLNFAAWNRIHGKMEESHQKRVIWMFNSVVYSFRFRGVLGRFGASYRCSLCHQHLFSRRDCVDLSHTEEHVFSFLVCLLYYLGKSFPLTTPYMGISILVCTVLEVYGRTACPTGGEDEQKRAMLFLPQTRLKAWDWCSF